MKCFCLSKVLEYDPATVIRDVNISAAEAQGKVWLGYSCNYAIYSVVPQVSDKLSSDFLTRLSFIKRQVCATHQVYKGSNLCHAWRLRDPEKQAEIFEVFKANTQESGLSQTSKGDERWTSLNHKLLQATKLVCSVSSNHTGRKQT